MPDRFDTRFEERIRIEFFDLEARDAAAPETAPSVGEPPWLPTAQSIIAAQQEVASTAHREPRWLLRVRAITKVAGPLAVALVALLAAAHEVHDMLGLAGLGGFLALLSVGSLGYAVKDKINEEHGTTQPIVMMIALVFAIAAASAFAFGARQQNPTHHHHHHHHQPLLPAPHLSSQLVDASATHLVDTGDGMFWWGGESVGRVGEAALFKVPDGINDVAVCSNSLIVSYGDGYAARYGLHGRRVANLQISTVPARITCDEASTYFSVTMRWSPSYVLRVRTTDLHVQAAIDIGGRLGPLGIAFNKLLVGDRLNGLVADVGVGQTENFVRDRMRGIPEPSRIEQYESGALVVESQRGCIRRLDLNQDHPDDEGVHLAGPVIGTASTQGSILVVYAGGRRMIRLDADDMRALGPAVNLPGDFRAASVDRSTAGWQLFDPRQHRLIQFSDPFLRALERATGHPAPRELSPCM